MYLASFIGAQVQYTNGWLAGSQDISYDTDTLTFGAFLEVSVVRLEFFQYSTTDKYDNGDKIKSDGYFVGLKFLL